MTPLGSGPAQAARFSATLLLTGAGLSTLWLASSGGQAGAWPLLVASSFFIVAFYVDHSLLRRTPLDLPLLIFLAAALVGVWAGYDPYAALSKFWMLIGAYLLFYALALQPGFNLPASAFLFSVLGLAIALFFLLTHDWQAFAPKFARVQGFAQAWASARPQLGLTPLHPNVAGGLMAIMAPFQLAVARRTSRAGKGLQTVAIVSALLITLLALILTSSRGAMLALLAGLFVWFAWQQAYKYRASLLHHRRILLALLGAIFFMGLLAISGGGLWQIARALDRLPGPASAVSRAQLAGQTLDLITDYPLTGAGLAAFPGLYSRYILGIPYYFLPNGHNIFLDITLEQGVVGVFAFLLIVVLTFSLLLRRAPRAGAFDRFHTTLAGAAIASFSVLLIHGLVEDTVYGSVALPLLFAVPGLAAALNHVGPQTHRAEIRAWDRRNAAAAGIVALAVFGASASPQGRALWSANLGAISMARVELAGFPTDQWVQLDDGDALRDATARFQNALRLYPQQRTALYRLGLLLLQRQDFSTAAHYLQQASAIDPAHIGVRKALGYSYAWSGDRQQAVQTLQGVPFVAQELEAYVAWWQQQGRRDLAQTAGQMRPYFFDTDNEQ